MKKAYLTYAINQEGELVHVDSVPNGNECGCKCPACNKPLQAKNEGRIKSHHFAHQQGVDCPTAYETSLHLLAKEKIQKAFYEKDVFNIEYEYGSFCTQFEECNYVRYSECVKYKRNKFNLKDYYDTCEQEIPYDEIKRRSDLKIWSKKHPKRRPIYIEFFVTHPSDDAKLHSGCLIIEAKIEDENDIDYIISNGLTEGKRTGINHKMEPTSKISFWGFKSKDFNNNKINQEIIFSRFILYESGKFQCYQDTCLCKELKRVRSKALCEICYHTSVAFGIHEIAKWTGYKRFGIKNCLLCKNYVDSYDGLGKLCRLYKSLGINRFGKHDTARAKTCYNFILNEEEMNNSLKWNEEDRKCPTTELK